MFGKITKDNAFLLYIIVALYQNTLSQSKLRLTSTSAQAVSVDSANQKYYELFIHRRLFSYFFRFQCMSSYDWYGKNGCHEKYFSFQFISNKCSIVAFFVSLSILFFNRPLCPQTVDEWRFPYAFSKCSLQRTPLYSHNKFAGVWHLTHFTLFWDAKDLVWLLIHFVWDIYQLNESGVSNEGQAAHHSCLNGVGILFSFSLIYG